MEAEARFPLHTIKRLTCLYNEQEVNVLIRRGWVLLDMYTVEGAPRSYRVEFILGNTDPDAYGKLTQEEKDEIHRYRYTDPDR